MGFEFGYSVWKLVSEFKLRWFIINWCNLLDCLSSQRIIGDLKVKCTNLKSEDFMAHIRVLPETKSVERRGMHCNSDEMLIWIVVIFWLFSRINYTVRCNTLLLMLPFVPNMKWPQKVLEWTHVATHISQQFGKCVQFMRSLTAYEKQNQMKWKTNTINIQLKWCSSNRNFPCIYIVMSK